jgi:hypothetical protein
VTNTTCRLFLEGRVNNDPDRILIYRTAIRTIFETQDDDRIDGHPTFRDLVETVKLAAWFADEIAAHPDRNAPSYEETLALVLEIDSMARRLQAMLP